jgi:small subunit ribosomal protein S8
MNDTVSDFLTRLRNAYRAKHEDVQIPYSILTEKIANVMFVQGYVDGVEVVGEGVNKTIVIKVKYVDEESVINGLKRVSKPSCRIYVGYKEIKPVLNGLGISVLSTPAGVMSDVDARKKRVGGEVLCNIW